MKISAEDFVDIVYKKVGNLTNSIHFNKEGDKINSFPFSIQIHSNNLDEISAEKIADEIKALNFKNIQFGELVLPNEIFSKLIRKENILARYINDEVGQLEGYKGPVERIDFLFRDMDLSKI